MFKSSRSPVVRAEEAVEVQPAPFSGATVGSSRGAPVWAQRAAEPEPKPWQPFANAPEEPNSSEEVLPADEGLQVVAEQLEEAYQEAFARGLGEGHAEGLKQGRAEGEAEAQAQVGVKLEEFRRMCESLEAELQRVLESRAQLVEQLEEDTVELAMHIGEKLAADAQLRDVEWVAPLVRDAAGALTEADRVICAVSPELASRLQEAGVTMAGNGVLMEVREGLKPLDVVVESRFGRVDASFAERIEHLRRVAQEQLDQPHEANEQEVA